MRVAASANLIDDREYAAPPELVFEVWTRAEHFARWFGPDNVEVSLCEIDARPGGVLRFQHRFPAGQLVSIRGVFDEVVPPTRLSFTVTFVDANDRPTVNAMMPDWPVGAHIVMTVEFFATAGGTRMTVAQRVADPDLAESAPSVRHRKLAAIAWPQTAQRLGAYLERRPPADTSPSAPTSPTRAVSPSCDKCGSRWWCSNARDARSHSPACSKMQRTTSATRASSTTARTRCDLSSSAAGAPIRRW